MNKPENADKSLAASKAHYSVKVAARRCTAWIAAGFKSLALKAAGQTPVQTSVQTLLRPKPRAVKPITLKLGASRRLALLLLVIMLMALASVLTLAWLMPWPWWWRFFAVMMACPVLLVLGWQALRRHAWRQADDAVLLLALDREGAYHLTLRDGRQLAVRLQHDSVVFASLSLLNFRLAQGKGKITCLILPDAVDADAFRRLRVWLRWGPLEEEEAPLTELTP